VAQIYDGFSASVIYGLESYGFCREGDALDFIQDGRIEFDGELPLNTFGGSLGTGRIHGLWHIIEGALQASGRPGSRQVKDAKVSFVGAGAPIVTGTSLSSCALLPAARVADGRSDAGGDAAYNPQQRQIRSWPSASSAALVPYGCSVPAF
jgi:hypothetical protein